MKTTTSRREEARISPKYEQLIFPHQSRPRQGHSELKAPSQSSTRNKTLQVYKTLTRLKMRLADMLCPAFRRPPCKTQQVQVIQLTEHQPSSTLTYMCHMMFRLTRAHMCAALQRAHTLLSLSHVRRKQREQQKRVLERAGVAGSHLHSSLAEWVRPGLVSRASIRGSFPPAHPEHPGRSHL